MASQLLKKGQIFFEFPIIVLIMLAGFSPTVYAGIGDDHDADGDNYSPNEGDCDDSDPTVYPGNGCDYPAREDIEQIEDEIDELILNDEFDINSAQADNLIYKLQHAAEKVEENKINTAINNLNSFINQINAYINSGAISEENGNGLIAEVQAIIDYLS